MVSALKVIILMTGVIRSQLIELMTDLLITQPYRGTSLIRKRLTVGPYSRPMPMALWCSWVCGCFLMSEVPL